MAITKEKPRSRAKNQRRRPFSKKSNGKSLNDQQLAVLLEAYQTMGNILETLVGRERLYRPKFLKGLENALQEVAAGRAQEVKTFEDFAS